ncbi:protein sly1 [Histomonas meleagridis]|uniref:protein sly1-like n=1 Tax=Histomonas meleagridis TaxID=135588 RepID=UPI00355A2917|nr:protein sly1 [Histomonas meleagridis]KAH0806878.1 protein sly1-like [Histomonas meleagridis]
MLRKKQRELIQRILNLNEAVSNNPKDAMKWKVLIFDDRGLYILTTLMKVARLLEVGVTFFSHIDKKRDPIPDADVIYFLEPTEENIHKIAKDCSISLYESINISFISPCPSDLLEQFAVLISNQNCSKFIKTIFDQYVNFSSPEPHLFTLFEKDTTIHDIFGFKTNDDLVNTCINSIANGLVSVFLTSGEIPRVLFQNNNEAAHLVVTILSEKIRPLSQNFELWESRRSQTNNYRPPLLIILDRTMDFAGPLHHPSTYAALIEDNLGINKNEVKVDGKLYDLDNDIDKFWIDNKFEVFDTVASTIGKEVNSFITKYGSIEENLSTAINNFPELSHQRLSLLTHTKIADSLLKCIKSRNLDSLFKFEEDIFLQNGVDLPKLIDFVKTIPNDNDKLRLVSIAYLYNIIPNNEIQTIEDIIDQSLEFLPNYFENFKIAKSNNKGNIQKLLKHVSGFGSKSNLNEMYQQLPIVETTRRILEENIDGFNLMNIQTGKIEQPTEIGNVYVFVIGPGSYVEMNGLMDIAQKNNIELTYGCTAMIQPNEFMKLMQKIGY